MVSVEWTDGGEIDLGDAYLFAVFADIVHGLLNML